MIKVEKHNAHGLNLVVTLSKSEAENLIARLVNAVQLKDKNYVELQCLFEDDNNRWESCELDFDVQLGGTTMEATTKREMPRYQCHKKVWALKIKSITPEPVNADGAVIVPVEEGYEPFLVSQEYMDKHKPQAGGYYVVYEDGYKSFSPTKAFEDGYTLWYK